MRKPVLSSGFPTMSDTNLALQPQKMARNLKFKILEIEGLCFLCSETITLQLI